MKVLSNCGSEVSELIDSHHFSKKEIYDFVLLGTYVGGKYGDASDEWVCLTIVLIEKKLLRNCL